MAKIYFCRRPFDDFWYTGQTPEKAFESYCEDQSDGSEPDDLEWVEGETKIPTVIRSQLSIVLNESVFDPKIKKTTKRKTTR